MSKEKRLKFMNYAKGNTTRLKDKLLTKYYRDFSNDSNLLNNAINENNFDISKVVNKSDKPMTSIVRGLKRSRLLSTNSKTYYSYYGIIKGKRGLSPSWLPKYTIQDTYYNGRTQSEYKLTKKQIKVDDKNLPNEIIDNNVRKERNKLFLTRYNNLSLKLVSNSQLKFEGYYKAINQ